MNAKSLGVLILTCLILIGAGMFLYTKKLTQNNSYTNPEPTGIQNISTNVYSNTAYKYSISYPEGWSKREYPDTMTGAAFRPSDMPNDYQYEYITITYGAKALSDIDLSFKEYVKVAASHEIQNYESLVSMKKVTTKSGIVGYETTWNVLPFMNDGSGKTTVSQPITYFPVKNDNKGTIQISLLNADYIKEYEEILSTFNYTE